MAVVTGTRPDIIKMASIIDALDGGGYEYGVIHTGQHYDNNLSGLFFDELGLPTPDRYLDVGSGSQAMQTAAALTRLEESFMDVDVDVVLVQGDTNTTLAGALAAVKLGIDVGHVEAGLRSYDMRMPEEHNRRVVDHLSSMLFAPTAHAADILKGENVWGEVHVTGNTVIDACMRYSVEAEKRSNIMSQIAFDEFALATAHRAENVDNLVVLKDLVAIFTRSPLPVVYPIHPRTVKRLNEYGLYEEISSSGNVQLIPPIGYFDFLVLMKHCSFILSDSGGIQEEATTPVINKKVFVLRKSTERPEAVEAGFAEVVGTNPNKVLMSVAKFMENPVLPSTSCPFGRGDAGPRIVKIIAGKI